MRSERAIAVDKVPAIFDDRCLRDLACVLKLPAAADFCRFATSVRGAVRAYALAVRVLSANDLYREVETLYRAADREQYGELARLLDCVPAEARAWLDERGKRPGFQSIYGKMGVKLPLANDVRSPAHREQACKLVRLLCTEGGGIIEGRRRPTGRRSRTYRTLLYAPIPRRHFAKRDAELDLVMSLQSAVHSATGQMPALTAHHDSPGPFARMTQKVLCLAGAPHADAIGLINELHRRRREMQRRALKREGRSDEHPVK